MATLQLQASYFLHSASFSSSCLHASLHSPKFRSLRVPLPKLKTRKFVENLNQRNGQRTITTKEKNNSSKTTGREVGRTSNSIVIVEQLYAILEAVSDRIEMHVNIGEQRNNWNSLLLSSINIITMTAATMAGLASIGGAAAGGAPILALKLSSILLYSAATGMLLVMNKIQPSQLAEEQRNAARLFKQLRRQVETTFALGSTPTTTDIENALEKVLVLDKAYPLPLLGGVMLEKFPKVVEPAVWWPKGRAKELQFGEKVKGNGWDAKLEEEMREIVGVLERKDIKEYLRLSKMILNVNKVLAVSGPLLTAMAALGSSFVGSPASHGSWAAVVAVAGGALATVVNVVEHGGQVGMIFEMYRGCAGSFQQLQESIEATLEEKDVERRENGELFKMKVALQLGRSPSELPNLAGCSLSTNVDASEKFASKLL